MGGVIWPRTQIAAREKIATRRQASDRERGISGAVYPLTLLPRWCRKVLLQGGRVVNVGHEQCSLQSCVRCSGLPYWAEPLSVVAVWHSRGGGAVPRWEHTATRLRR
ncbi:hypothetical protein NDU88_002145 [Pleurodeles waltl]|uniref:Uncharacterized protein n=1 Tax=Pleurodeles waltl TaxID=8319 RepID=A0AAV7T207_PLEWA|nr:hypothetical protein NDU88_002145 [Pleurodeles waltl]